MRRERPHLRGWLDGATTPRPCGPPLLLIKSSGRPRSRSDARSPGGKPRSLLAPPPQKCTLAPSNTFLYTLAFIGGSAFDLGTRALLAVQKAHDGRGAPTALSRALLRRLGLGRPEELVAWAYSPGGDRAARVAGLAPAVVECAVAGDAVAETIIRHGVGELAR